MTIENILSRTRALPAAAIAVEVNEKLDAGNSLVVTAPPGAGKSTLLPLTMMAGSRRGGKIILVEPRRLAARQIAMRMADILGEPVGNTVGYRVRFETRVSAATRIEVVTEGVFLRMVISDPTLDGVSIVVFDEFHERSINSDLAFALVRQTRDILREDLRIVVMSATIDVGPVCKALKAPLLKSEGRMFPVKVVYADEDAVEMRNHLADLPQTVASTVSKVHRFTQGDILVFLPGQAEIQRVSQLLGDSLSPTEVMPLYGNLTPEAQHRAIAPSAVGSRKVVLATPVAETSLTIEGVRVVVDTGLCRRPVYNVRNGLTRLDTVAVSKDMMIQRTGRAGRVAEGVCFRMWRAERECQFAEQRTPEILAADLTPLVLGVAAFGETDVFSLPWLTVPAKADIEKARQTLQLLDAVDTGVAITPTGRQMSAMPCHPRISRMIIGCPSEGLRALACDIAAIIEEKDPMAAEPSADITLRIDALRQARARKSPGRWQRVAMVAREYLRMASAREDNSPVSPAEIGSLLALAYPERVARAVDSVGNYRLASGDNVSLDTSDSLSAHEWIVVASLFSSARSGRACLAAPVDSVTLTTRTVDNIAWSSRAGCVVMQREERIGKLVVCSKPLQTVDNEGVVRIVCEAVKKYGLSMLDWNDDVARLQNRIAAVASWHPELALPDVSTERLMQTPGQWLAVYLEQGGKVASSVAELKKLNLKDMIWAIVPYDLQQQINRLAPEHIKMPNGHKIRIDYRPGASAPVVSVRLQECFGMTETPTVDDGRRPLLMELLSPGFKPVQLTQDLANFWRETYFEVRKELKRRYPKHAWPDNPV